MMKIRRSFIPVSARGIKDRKTLTMANWLYPEVVQRVKQACIVFMAGTASIEQCQAALPEAEQEIVGLDETWLRTMIIEAANQLQTIRFTVPDNKQDAQTRGKDHVR